MRCGFMWFMFTRFWGWGVEKGIGWKSSWCYFGLLLVLDRVSVFWCCGSFEGDDSGGSGEEPGLVSPGFRRLILCWYRVSARRC